MREVSLDRLRAQLDEQARQAGELRATQRRLEAANAQLEMRTRELEQQNEALELAKHEAERASRHKSESLANMSHELRTPLNSALILAQLLAQNTDGGLSERQVRYAETIYTSGNNLLAIINDILDLARIESGEVDGDPASRFQPAETFDETSGPRPSAEHDGDDLFQGKTILIVEDDIRNIFALTSVFEPRGARVVIARNGREGIDQVERIRPDLVLMDIMMPEMDGLSATRVLRQTPAWRTLPIIALTAKATTTDYQQCVAAGVTDYLAKPLDVDKLVSVCHSWIAR
jgi:CheY-like chemotaxis protein